MNFISAGNIFRQIAKERGHTLEEFSILAKDLPNIDLEIDERTKKYGQVNNTVIDAQLAAYFTPKNNNSVYPSIIKICITASPETRWRRISKRDGISFEDAKHETNIREEMEAERFKSLYQITVDDLSVYDIVIQSDNLAKEFVYDLVKQIIVFSRDYQPE